MEEPMTQLVKEFLEVNDYLVRVNTKIDKGQRTMSDIDILAHRIKTKRKIQYIPLNDSIIGEVKNYRIIKKGTWGFENIYKKAFEVFEHEENVNIMGHIVPIKDAERVLFCFSATTDTLETAEIKKITIISASYMVKNLIGHINSNLKENKNSWAYYPGWPIYSFLRHLIDLLSTTNTYAGKDRLLIENLIFENVRDNIENHKTKKSEKEFINRNSKFLRACSRFL